MSFTPYSPFRGFGGGAVSKSIAERYRAAVMADSPVAYWRLGESSGTMANDETGTHPGTYVGSPTLGEAGVFGGNAAMRIAAGSQRMSSANTAALQLANYGCVELWVRTPNIAALSKFFVLVGKGYLSGWCFAIDHRSAESWLAWRSSGGSTMVNWNSNPLLREGNWLHIVVSWSLGSATAWINSESQGTIAITPVTAQTHELRIGNDSLLPNHTLVGTVDEVAIYDAPLSAARIAAHYAAAGY